MTPLDPKMEVLALLSQFVGLILQALPNRFFR